MENYKEKYENLINQLKTEKEEHGGYTFSFVIDKILPELSESEDERIREALIDGFNKLNKSAVWYNGITNGQILAWLEKQGEQKSTWSEEDEKMLDSIIDCIDGLVFIDSDQLNWLKSIKDRVQPQAKQEWSEEDEENMDAVWKACGQVYGTKYQSILGDWLKSLKFHWKPNDEQKELTCKLNEE